VAVDGQVQARHFPRLERIMKVTQKSKQVVFALAAFLEPLTDRASLKCRFRAFRKTRTASEEFVEDN
jgi:hypothetical protein